MAWPQSNDGRIDDRERRVIRNEALFRQVNERIEDVSSDVPAAEFLEFVCECGEEACGERIQLSRGEYEDVRARPQRFAIAPRHEHPDFETTIEANERFVLIEKFGEGAEIAERTDPRG